MDAAYLRARERVKKYHDWEHVVDRYEELFAKMAGGQPVHRIDDFAFNKESIGEHEISITGERQIAVDMRAN